MNTLLEGSTDGMHAGLILFFFDRGQGQAAQGQADEKGCSFQNVYPTSSMN